MVIVLIVVTISECQQQNIRSVNFSVGADRRQSWQNIFWAPTASTRRLIDDGVLIEDGSCRLTTTDKHVHKMVHIMLKDEVTLIEYQLSFRNYSYNPLAINVSGAYDAERWARVTTAHGQTLLSLAFNHGVLSMMTLTLGTKMLNVELQDSPPGCMAALSGERKIDSVRQLLMRDFDADGSITTVDDARVCNEIVVDDGGYAKFRHNCCYENSVTGRTDCTTDIGNVWLYLLNTMLTIVRISLIFLGPSLFMSPVLSMSKDSVPYIVRLKSKLVKTVCFYRADKTGLPPVSAERVLNLSSEKGFPKLQKCLEESNIQLGQPTKVRFPQYDITVDYGRMQKENVVRVGLFYSLFRAIFICQIRYLGPFTHCCKAKIFRADQYAITWGRFCKILAKILLILLLPTPLYLRLIIFYVFEYDEVEKRKRAIAVGGLKESPENSLMHYLTPTHGLFICMYVLYVVTAIALAFISQKGRDRRVKKVIVNSFRELKSLNFTDTLSMMASNMVWPLKNFGVLGCCVGIIYWPLAIIGSLIVGTVYLLPTLYLTFRMIYHSKLAAVVMSRKSNNSKYKVRVKPDLGVYRFQTEKLLQKWITDDGELGLSQDGVDNVVPQERVEDDVASNKSTLIRYAKFSWLRVAKYVFCAFVCISTLYSVVIILSEVIGCLVEIIVFTIMGCIVNSGALLKYVLLIIMMLVYCSDCFNNMQQKYLRMNRALFNEVKHRIKDLEKVTSLPSLLQENCAFKSQELNEQAKHEDSDNVAEKPANHWMINDLVLFVDSEDTPRIPIHLFNKVIHIRVAGVPGPIYRGHIEAFQQLFKLVIFVLFVFLVVLSFGSVYKISATNETLATLVGGFLPMMLRTFLAPPRPAVELGTVSFKSKMDEVIKNFYQCWPIYDLPFKVMGDKDDDENAEAKTESNDINKNELPTTKEWNGHNEENNRTYSIDMSFVDDDLPLEVVADEDENPSAEAEESKRDNEQDSETHSIDKKYVDEIDESTVLLPDQPSMSFKKSEGTSNEVDIAICLPSWPEN